RGDGAGAAGDLVLVLVGLRPWGTPGPAAVDLAELFVTVHPLVGGDRLGDLVAVVDVDEPDLLAVDPAVLVRPGHPVTNALRVGFAHVGGDSREVEDAADLDLLLSLHRSRHAEDEQRRSNQLHVVFLLQYENGYNRNQLRMRRQRSARPSGSKTRKSTMVRPKTASLSGVKSCTRWGKLPESALVVRRSTSGSSVRKTAPRMEPTTLPRPPMMIIPRWSMATLSGKFSGLMMRAWYASSEPATPT